MEVEVKLRLPDSTAHQKLTTLLSPYRTKTHFQQNLFFDTNPKNTLSKHSSTLRLRFYNMDTHATLTLKSKPKITNGISQAQELEEPIDPTIARTISLDPTQFATLVKESKILQKVESEYGVVWDEMVCLGGFKNVRFVYEWNGLKLEVDESLFDFGVSYEIECECDDPQEAQVMIEEMLRSNAIRFSYSKVSKFGVFRSGKLPEFE
ncbi:CYTH-like domain-containing protein [Artemisia annua]|uniref:CYTH-like domain-containing protein n=1 Tax=Artemisia annua TaxID=35608 RepID=A0A2U1NC78_ARTAN|nr:CYTH-like domain-containing protein [Artemisia annua]